MSEDKSEQRTRRAQEAPSQLDRAVPPWLQHAAAVSWRALVVATVVALVVFAISRLLLVVVPVLIALFLASALWAPTQALKRRGLPDGLAALAVVGAAAVLAVAAVALVGVPVVEQADELERGLQQSLRKVAASPAGSALGGSPEQLAVNVERAVRAALQGGAAARGLSATASALTGVVLVAVVLFFLVKEGDRLWTGVVRRVHEPHRAAVSRFGDRAWQALRAYFVTVVTVALIDAALIGVGLLVLGVPLVLSLAVLTFLAAFFPVIGAFAAGVVAVLVAFVGGGTTDAAIVAALVVLVQQLEGNVLYPLIMRRRSSLHPLTTIVAVAVGGTLAGVLGAFLAVPIAVIASAGTPAVGSKEHS